MLRFILGFTSGMYVSHQYPHISQEVAQRLDKWHTDYYETVRAVVLDTLNKKDTEKDIENKRRRK